MRERSTRRVGFQSLLAFVLWVGFGGRQADGQKVEITPSYGYQVGGALGASEGELRIPGGVNYGLTLNVELTRNLQLEIFYSRQETQLDLKEPVPFGKRSKLFDMNVEYFHGGLSYPFRKGTALRPFMSVTAGATRFGPQETSASDEWRFSVAAGGGVKAFLSKNLGFRLQGQVLVPFLAGGGRIFCSSPGVCIVGADVLATVQANASGGVVLAF